MRTCHSAVTGQLDQFPLTFRGIRYRQHSTVFPKQILSFKPAGKEDLKWSKVAKNPVTPIGWRAGFFVLPLPKAIALFLTDTELYSFI